jgi:hypothetical protein
MRAYNLHAEQRDQEAMNCLNSALAMEPTLTGALFLKGIIALSHGDYRTGLPLFELRHQRIDAGKYGSRYQDRPMWDGRRTIHNVLLWADEGLGDSVMMLRFVPEVRKRCRNLQIELQHPVVRLCQSNNPDADIFAYGDRNPSFDFQCSLMSLPLLFGVTAQNIPGQAYIKPLLLLAADWAKRTNGIKLGLCWHGNKNNVRDDVRSIDQIDLAPLAKEFDFISLSREEAGFDDVADMAALINNLDLVVTVDTLVAHVAGAMGKPTFVMLGVDCDWRWGQRSQFTPWYPSARLFRQNKSGDWAPVIVEVIEAIKEFQGASRQTLAS